MLQMHMIPWQQQQNALMAAIGALSMAIGTLSNTPIFLFLTSQRVSNMVGQVDVNHLGIKVDRSPLTSSSTARILTVPQSNFTASLIPVLDFPPNRKGNALTCQRLRVAPQTRWALRLSSKHNNRDTRTGHVQETLFTIQKRSRPACVLWPRIEISQLPRGRPTKPFSSASWGGGDFLEIPI